MYAIHIETPMPATLAKTKKTHITLTVDPAYAARAKAVAKARGIPLSLMVNLYFQSVTPETAIPQFSDAQMREIDRDVQAAKKSGKSYATAKEAMAALFAD